MKRMVKRLRHLTLSSVLMVGIAQPAPVEAEGSEEHSLELMSTLHPIDEGIFDLDYRKEEVLSFPGEQVESFVPREGILKGDTFIVVERNKKSLGKTPIDISIVDSMIDRTYPGAIQLADQDYVNNMPNLVSVRRDPINISIDLPGMQGENTVTVDNPTYGNVKAGIDELIATWSDKHSATHTLPARMQYAESMVHSQSQIQSALNINANILNNVLGIDFNRIKTGEKQTMITSFKQIYYTVSAEKPHHPSDLFHESVTYRDLTRRGVSNERPPLMVSNVSYGRNIYVKLETESTDKNVELAFKALIDGQDVSKNKVYSDILENTQFTAVVLGGDSGAHSKVITKDFDQIQEIIMENAEFSLKNPAYPISYTSNFLKDNAVAAVHNYTEYVETESTEYSSGRINLKHTGAYVAQFEVTWDEVSYDAEGNEVLEPKTWSDNHQGRTAPFSSTIYLPANAKNINIMAKECTGLAWEWWRTVLDERNVPLTQTIDVSIGGTTLHPRGSIDYHY